MGELQSLIKSRTLVWNAIFSVMKHWPVRTISELRCDALMIVGTQDENVMEWARQHPQMFDGVHTRLEVLEGYTHEKEFQDMEAVVPLVHHFLESLPPESTAG